MKFDVIIVGAGIVGLATAVNILRKNPETKLLLIEKEFSVAMHQTGNNSGVIHSGIYYKPGSYKALNCREGYRMLIDFCNENEIDFDLCGKLIVATDENELPELDKIYKRGLENGLDNLKIIEKEEINEYEPYVKGLRAIHVPQTGIIDYKKVSEKYLDYCSERDAQIKFGEEVVSLLEKSDSTEIITDRGSYIADKVIISAGLFSDKLASMTNKEIDFKIIPFRGEYYKLKEESRKLVNNLIYPVPNPDFPFLGVHFTRMINGEVEAGPNAVFSFKREGYNKFSFSLSDTVESLTFPGFLKVASKFWKVGAGEFYRSLYKPAFVKALQKLIPEIKSEDLVPGGAGVRAQACDIKGALVDDFLIKRSKRVINVCNAPSPAATASLAIGKQISQILDD